ncbi:uncharacterized protein LOC120530872 [Polypterus senegalus]|uniref:uncharacterized protein LOC120530872 n=1 Tax=Polypterus senegalus TaxID=55291 RepID=UPI0019644435|nr:uncharacterized protein LOC120530872 [Polypterus senegalus]XP_039611526.1 uncharacterized protein LOC120530872 [Polypterus senegalus]
MGCCSNTARHSGIDHVGPDEIELLEIDSHGLWSLAESNHLPPPSAKTGGDVTAVKKLSVVTDDTVKDSLQSQRLSVVEENLRSRIVMWEETRQSLQEKIYREPIAGWEGPSVLSLGEAIWSSLVYLQDNYTQEKKEAYLVLFSFHLLILEADHATNRFIYQGTLPLSGMSVEEVRKDNVVNMFTVSCPMVDARIVICTSASELQVWLQKTEERIQKTSNQQSSITHSVLSYLLPCNEKWKKQELKRYLLHSPIENWEGSAIQHLGEIVYLSLVQISSFKGERNQERLLILFPSEIIFLSTDVQRSRLIYQGRLPLKSIKALEKSALPGRLEFELSGTMMDAMLIRCSSSEDYENWIFRLQQPEEMFNTLTDEPPPLIPKKRRS